MSNSTDLEMVSLLTDLKKKAKDIADEVINISQSSSDDFINIGNALQLFYEKSENITQLSREISTALSSDEIHASVTNLQNLLSKIDSLREVEKNRDSWRFSRLTETRKMVSDLITPLEGLGRDGLILQMMGISVKVESRQLDGSDAGFSGLAKDIKTHGKYVNENSAGIVERVFSLSEQLMATLKLSQQNSNQGIFFLSDVIKKAEEATDAIQELKLTSQSTAEDVVESYNEIQNNIAGVVVSSQFQDITRQQMEHVSEALEKVVIKIENELKDEMPQHHKLALLKVASDVIEIQNAQLNHALNEFVSAVSNIIQNMGNIAERIEIINQSSGSINKTSDNIEIPPLQRVENNINAINSALQKNVENEKKISQIVLDSAKQVNTVTEFIDDIVYTNSNIELVAMNARIKASQARGNGATLDVLAGEIHKLSMDTRRLTQKISSLLKNLENYTRNLIKEIDEQITENENNFNPVLEDIQQYIDKIKTTEKHIDELLEKMEVEASQLSESITDEVSGIKIHYLIENNIGVVMEKLDQLKEEISQIIPSGFELNDQEQVDLKNLYTMDSERKIHALKVKNGDYEEFNNTNENDDEFDDNIELF